MASSLMATVASVAAAAACEGEDEGSGGGFEGEGRAAAMRAGRSPGHRAGSPFLSLIVDEHQQGEICCGRGRRGDVSGFPVCRPCYEYERKDGTQACPQCKIKYKRHKGTRTLALPEAWWCGGLPDSVAYQKRGNY